MIRILLFVIIVCTTISCNSRKEKQLALIDKLLNESDDSRSIDKFERLFNVVKMCPSCLDSFNLQATVVNGKVDKNLLQQEYFDEIIDTTKQKIKAQIFLENSASMWGYFKGSTDAEKVISRILLHSDLRFGKQVTEFYYITDSIYPLDSNDEFDEYITKLEPTDMQVGNYKDTRIADIIKRVINNTNENELSILFSDCIYSLNHASSTESSQLEWTAIESAFARLLQRADFSVFIVKYISQFNGTYYSLLESGREHKNTVGGKNDDFIRPYYAIVIGETNLIKAALKEIDFKSYAGYQNSYFITQPRPSKRIDYRIINSHKIGEFRPDKKNRKTGIVDAEKMKRGPNEGIFQYTVVVNFDEIGVENDYLIDNSKYVVTGEYQVDVKDIPEEDKRIDLRLSPYSHYIHISTVGQLKKEEVLISLKRETPKWIDDTHTAVDNIFTKEYQNKTRGFKDLVEGVENAFDFAHRNDDAKYYFTIKTKINL